MSRKKVYVSADLQKRTKLRAWSFIIIKNKTNTLFFKILLP